MEEERLEEEIDEWEEEEEEEEEEEGSWTRWKKQLYTNDSFPYPTTTSPSNTHTHTYTPPPPTHPHPPNHPPAVMLPCAVIEQLQRARQARRDEASGPNPQRDSLPLLLR